MSTTALRLCTVSLILFAIIALAGCGSTHPVACAEAGCCDASSATCVAPQYVIATHTSGGVTVFPVNPGNGTIESPDVETTGGPTMGLGIATLNNQFLYTSDFQHASIDGWSLNLVAGSVSQIQGSPFGLGPLSLGAGLAVNNGAGILYVADVGKIDVLQADPTTGALSAISGSPVSSGTNLFLALDANNQFLFASDDDPPGGILAFTVDSTTGLLTEVAGSPFPAIPGSSGNAQPGQIAVDPSGNFVYMALYATNQVAAFSINKPAGTLTPVPGSPFAAGNGPGTLIITASSFLYVSNTTDGTVSGYKINSTGVLTQIGPPFAIQAGSFATNISGNFLYATGAGGIQMFSIDATTGALSALTGSPFADPGAALLTFVQ